MAAPPEVYAFDADIAREAAQRWHDHGARRAAQQQSLEQGLLDAVEPKERLAKRANRLAGHVREMVANKQVPVPPTLRMLVERGEVKPEQVENAFMERVIGETRDFLAIEFLERALVTNRSVGRIVTRLSGNRRGFGTGFLVSPRLLLTNQHVLRTDGDADRSVVEFDYQFDGSGQPLAVQRFTLDPGSLFLNDRELDFALVAVSERSERNRALADYGYCPLVGAEGKITVGEPVNIIQHPRGEMKEIVIRENHLLDLLDRHLHYAADTDPGSSGSPVFNDQWEVVALHHSGVPATDSSGNLLDINGQIWKKGDDPSLLAWVANEGVRVSRLVAFIAQAPLGGLGRELRDQLLDVSRAGRVPAARAEAVGVEKKAGDEGKDGRLGPPGASKITFTVPLQVCVTLGETGS